MAQVGAMKSRLLLLALLTPAAYFACAAAALAYTRFQGGFAHLWLATGVLTASLAATPRRHWWVVLIPSAIASMSASTLFGMGAMLAAPFAAINVLEAGIGAWLLRRKRSIPNTLDSLGSVGHFMMSVGFIAPAIGGAFAAIMAFAVNHMRIADSWLVWFSGHSLGSITSTPLILLLLKGEWGKWAKRVAPHRRREAVILYALFTATTAYSFYQQLLPLLFLPLGPLTLICFRHDRVLPALSVLTLAVISAAFTAVDLGPLALIAGTTLARLQFLQFYLASVIVTILPVTADLNERRRLFRALRSNKARYGILLENTTDILIHLKPDGTILYASPSITRLSGSQADKLINTNALALVGDEWRSHVAQCHADVLSSQGSTVRFDYQAPCRDGRLRWFETQSKAVRNEQGEIESVVSVIRDIDARKRQELDLAVAAGVDPLTSLPNRRALAVEFNQPSDVPCSMALIDIDHFKLINDQYGHVAGDEALKRFASVTRSALRKHDFLARIGGEEFAILFRGLSAVDAQDICERVRAEVARAVTFHDGQAIRFTISAGVTDVRADLESTLAIADGALYQAKRAGRDRLKLAA